MQAIYENRKSNNITTRLDHTLIETPHLHNDLELIYLQKGTTGVACDNFREDLYPGDIFLSFPNQVHFYPKRDNGVAIHSIIIFSPTLCSEFKELFHRMTPVSPVVRAKDVPPSVPRLIQQVLKENEGDHPLRKAITRGYLIALLGNLFDAMEFREEKKSDGILLKNILNYCNLHYTEPLSLDVLAKELNVGKYHISHIFSEKLKISFPDYINGLRINYAGKILTQETDRSITEIAYDCGFNSTRTFNRAFLKHMKTTPREFRKKTFAEKPS